MFRGKLLLSTYSTALSEGDGICTACNLASKYTDFSPAVIRRWAQAVFLDFFGSTANIYDVDDETLEAELMSSRGKHPKLLSLMHNESFKLEALEYVREYGYKKGAPNLTLL